MRNPFKRKPKTTIYGRDKTWHRTDYFNVETYRGEVVAVWFRCQFVPFDQTEVDSQRAVEMKHEYSRSEDAIPGVVAIELEESWR